MISNNRTTILLLSIVVVFFILLTGTSIGSVSIPVSNILSIISFKLLGTELDLSIKKYFVSILWELRLPRVLLGFFVGASLAISGTTIQSVLKNPLASPYTLGVSSGVSLGVAIVVFFDISLGRIGIYSLPAIGLVFGLSTIVFVLVISNRIDRNLSNNTIILVGIVVSLFVNAILTLLIALSGEEIAAIIRWQMGSLSLKGWNYVGLIIPFFLISLIIMMYYNKELDAFTFGEEQAKTLGVEVEKVKKILIFAATFVCVGAISVSGIIGFIGLIAPHIVRRITGPNHRYVVPMSALFGGCFLVIADLIARTVISPSELPVGAVTALIGAPFFVYIYFRRQ